KQVINELRRLVCRPIGVNLEPVDETATMSEEKLNIVEGRQASSKTVKALEKLGINFICMTGNPGTGVTNDKIVNAISETRKHFTGL
ncbi:haloacid dehalogenase-like hydrolase, partial [Staphylococcus aureus]|nr:haloacid dehalogenase-like hydrolase [Staphylococcus aureus]